MDPNIIELTKLIGNYGIGVVCLAVLISLHVYNVRVTLPSLIDASRKELARVLTSFREELERERITSSTIIQTLAQSFKEGLEKERTNTSSSIQTLTDGFREELRAERMQCHEDHEKMMEAIQGNQSQLIQITAKQETFFRMLNSRKEKRIAEE